MWEVTLPAKEVPPELPEPALGINFARDTATERSRCTTTRGSFLSPSSSEPASMATRGDRTPAIRPPGPHVPHDRVPRRRRARRLILPPRGVRGSADTVVRASAYGIDDGYLAQVDEELLVETAALHLFLLPSIDYQPTNQVLLGLWMLLSLFEAMAIVADFMLVWLPAPTVSLRPPLAFSAGPIAKFFYSCPDNAFQGALAGTSYSLLQRVGAIVRNGSKLFAVGTGASLAMAIVADFMLVWLPAPTVSLQPPLTFSAGPIAKFFYSCPDNAFQVALAGTSYSLLHSIKIRKEKKVFQRRTKETSKRFRERIKRFSKRSVFPLCST